MTQDTCRTCGEPCSWADARFGGHCTPRNAGIHVTSHDTIVEGYHPGLGMVSGSLDLAKKVDAAKRAGYTVTQAKDIPPPGERPRVNTGKPTAWQKTLKAIDNGLLDGL